MSLTINILTLHQVNGVSNTQTGIIGTVEYEIVSNETQQSVKGFANLNYFNLDETSFIELKDLTEETVKSWVMQSIGEERMTMIEEQLSVTMVDDKPVITQNEISLPWNS